MQWLAAASRPFVRLLSFSTDSLLKLFPTPPAHGATVTEEEIHALLEEGSEAGVIERTEHAMVRNVFRLDDRQLGSLMVPRGDIVFLDLEEPLAENLRRIRETTHSRFPVCHGGSDDIRGIMPMRACSCRRRAAARSTSRRISSPSSTFRRRSPGWSSSSSSGRRARNMTLVIDEYGELQGLVTLQDVFEAIIGEFRPRRAEDAWAVQRDDGSWLLDGLIPIPELTDRLGLSRSRTRNARGYQTLSGLVMWVLGRVPQTGDVVTWQQWRLEVVDMDGKRIDKILATRITPLREAASADPD